MSHIKDDGERLIEFLNSLHPLNKKVIALARKKTFQIVVKKK